MKHRNPNRLSGLILITLLSSLTIAAQMRVDVSKRAGRIPKVCMDVVPASIDDKIDGPALLKEATCKGAGDMLTEYTYVMTASSREQDKKGKIKEESRTWEVFIPTLKSGMHAKGILLITKRNGVPVPPEELDKERLKIGERLEKEEEKINRTATPSPATETDSENVRGMLPLGMYTQTNVNRGAFGMRRGGASLGVHDFLVLSKFDFARREQKDGRDTLVLSFVPRPDAQYTANNKYMAQLKGEIWIDAKDRIVTQLVAWPLNAQAAANAGAPPAVYVEMMRVREGSWLPHIKRINGLDYPAIFDHVPYDSKWVFSDYIHFSTEVKDFKMDSPSKP
jgi:hypothetical protein